jgi:NADH-quinone oxidoreductase subunit I
MTSEYDFSVFEVKEHNFSFANLTAEEAEEKKRLYEQFVAEKEELKKSADSGQSTVDSSQSLVASQESEGPASNVQSPASKPVFKPSFKAKAVDSSQSLVASQESEGPASNVQSPASSTSPESEVVSPEVKKPVFKPSFKVKAKDPSPTSDVQRPTSKP